MTAVDHISYPFDPPSKDTFIPASSRKPNYEAITDEMENALLEGTKKPPATKNQISANQMPSVPNYKLSICSKDTATSTQVVPPLSPASSLSSSSTPFTTSLDRSCKSTERPLSQSMPYYQRRHTTGAKAAVPENVVESRPSVYLFIFVNPLSGNQQGNDLLQLPVQQFRLRQRPYVKVEILNILDPQDRQEGFERVLWVQNMIRERKLPPLPKNMTRHITLLSGGGDGTVMSVFEMLAQYRIDLDLLFFSCIPFGTGNDFSQVLGWGRTTKSDDVLGPRLAHLETMLLDRLDHGQPARLDVWQLVITSHPSGYVRRAGGPKKQQEQQQPAIATQASTQPPTRPPCLSTFTSATQCQHYSQQHIPRTEQSHDCTSVRRKMCNYVSIGVQGYVGSGFEQHRAGRRWANIWAYTVEGAKWLFHRKFPPVTNFISRIVTSTTDDSDPTTLLSCKDPYSPNSDTESSPRLTKHPIDLVIQNIPHIWGRQIDLWGDARSGLEIVEDRTGPTDPAHWQPQKANDGYLELMVINSMYSYIKKLANFRRHVSRIGQFGCPFNIEFRPPNEHDQEQKKHPYEKENIICIMCDGEFYEVKDPKEISFELFNQVWTLGRNSKCRLVRDEIEKPIPTL